MLLAKDYKERISVTRQTLTLGQSGVWVARFGI